MEQAEPRVGQLYNCIEQSKMHGGSPQPTLPESGDEVTLIRFRLDKDPDGPHIIDHGDQERIAARIHLLRRQKGLLPVYKFIRSGDCEYLGRYWVRSITDEAAEAAERSEVCGRPIRYVIRLGKAS
jgi:hypothetical protein